MIVSVPLRCVADHTMGASTRQRYHRLTMCDGDAMMLADWQTQPPDKGCDLHAVLLDRMKLDDAVSAATMVFEGYALNLSPHRQKSTSEQNVCPRTAVIGEMVGHCRSVELKTLVKVLIT